MIYLISILIYIWIIFCILVGETYNNKKLNILDIITSFLFGWILYPSIILIIIGEKITDWAARKNNNETIILNLRKIK